MAKDVISINGEERVVREDTAKAYRGVNWALISIAAFILIAALMFFSGVLTNVIWDPQPGAAAPAERHEGP